MPKQESIGYKEVDYDGLPELMKQAVASDQPQKRYLVVQEPAGSQVVLIQSGQRQTGGYSLEVIAAAEVGGKCRITYKETAPLRGTILTQALTNPWLALRIQTQLPIEVRTVAED